MNKKRTTVADWIKLLKEPYYSQALANIPSNKLYRHAVSVTDAIDRSMVWAETPQGHRYWSDVCIQARTAIAERRLSDVVYLEEELKETVLYDNIKDTRSKFIKSYNNK
jgi:hypothetical protein